MVGAEESLTASWSNVHWCDNGVTAPAGLAVATVVAVTPTVDTSTMLARVMACVIVDLARESAPPFNVRI